MYVLDPATITLSDLIGMNRRFLCMDKYLQLLPTIGGISGLVPQREFLL